MGAGRDGGGRCGAEVVAIDAGHGGERRWWGQRRLEVGAGCDGRRSTSRPMSSPMLRLEEKRKVKPGDRVEKRSGCNFAKIPPAFAMLSP